MDIELYHKRLTLLQLINWIDDTGSFMYYSLYPSLMAKDSTMIFCIFINSILPFQHSFNHDQVQEIKHYHHQSPYKLIMEQCWFRIKSSGVTHKSLIAKI